MLSRLLLAMAVAAAIPVGCGRKDITGDYRDTENPAIRYEFRPDGSWTATLSLKVPAGLFAHGAGQRLEGTYSRSGETLELKCAARFREDPVSGEFSEDRGEGAGGADHMFLIQEGVLVPKGPQDAVFASDLNPLGARRLEFAGGEGPR